MQCEDDNVSLSLKDRSFVLNFRGNLNMCVVVTLYYWIKQSKLPKFSSFVEILHFELPQKVKCMQILFSLVFSLLTKSRNRRINFGATVVVVKLPLCRLCWLHTEPEWPIQAAQPHWIKDNRIFDINPHKETLATAQRVRDYFCWNW